MRAAHPPEHAPCHLDRVEDRPGSNDHPGKKVIVPCQILAGAVHHQVDAVFQRAQVDRCGECAVGHGRDPVRPGDLHSTRQVYHPQVRVGRRLEENQPRVGPDRCLERPGLIQRHEGHLDVPLAQKADGKFARAAVAVKRHDQMIAAGEQGQHRRRNGAHAGREKQGALPAFQGRQLALSHSLRGVAVPPILVPDVNVGAVLARRSALHVREDLGGILKGVRGGLDDGGRQRTVGLALVLASVDGLR